MAQRKGSRIKWSAEDVIFGALLSTLSALILKNPADLNIQFVFKALIFVLVLGLFSLIMRRCLEMGLNLAHAIALIFTPTVFKALEHWVTGDPHITDSHIVIFAIIMFVWVTLVWIREKDWGAIPGRN